ncbi:MAG: sugar ABC transporter substrate-binding protein [Chloroflexi bacterium]|nr:sugar ABC transporter substrate-binding protein [Chloroflexota bacterium]
MLKKQLWLIMLSLLSLSLVLSACGSDTADEPVETDTDTEVAEPVADADTTEETETGDVALRWRTRPDNQEEADVYQSISDELAAQLDGVSLVYEPGGSETASYQDVLKTELASGTAPDVFWIPGTDVADFATRGLLLDMRDLADAASGYSDDDFYAGPMFHLTFNSETGNDGEMLWGLPRDVSTFALYINLDLLAEAGVDDPRELEAAGEWDWDAFLETSEAVSALGSDIQGYGGSAWWGPYGVWMNAAGGGFFNDSRTACNLDSAESLAGLTFAQQLYTESGSAVPYGEDAEPPFRAGNVGMFQNGRWATPGIRTVDFEWDVVGLPDGPAGSPGNWLFWGAYVVNANTAHPEKAWELVQALTTAEVQGQVAALGANVPSRVSQEALDAFLTFTPPANNQAFLDGLANSPTAEGPLWAGSWPEFATVMDAAISSLLTGETTVDDFAGSVCDEANKAFGGEAPAAETPAEPMEEATLRWRTRPDNQEEADVYQNISDQLTGQLDSITLEYEPGGSETASYQDVLKTELASGTAPDVFWIPGTDVADFATRGLLYDLRDLADGSAGYNDGDFYAGPMFHLAFDPESDSSGSVLWGLPRDVSTFALYLNMDLIYESGADDPRELEAAGEWTWDAFLEVSEAVSALGSDVQGYGGSAWWGPYGVWMNAAGGGFFNDSRTACNLDSAESLAGLTFARQLYMESGSAVPYGEDAEPPFRAGNVGIFQNGRWATPGIRTVDFEWDVVGLPDGPAGSPGNWLFWGAYVVNANTAHPEAAWELVQALTTAKVQGQVAALGANVPSRVSQEALDAFLTFTPPANNQAFLDGLANNPTAEGPLWAGSWPEFATVMDAAISSLLTGETTVDDFAGSVCGEANKAFGN